jgi:methionyl-tRNA formyltransferase
MTVRVAYIGCVAMSRLLLDRLIDLPDAQLVGVVTRQRSPANSDFASLADLAERAKAPVHFADDGDERTMAAFLERAKPDVTFCCGWSKLLKSEVLSIAPRGTIGFHPAALPANRGRHPLIWALALGLEETASTFFAMDAGADSGAIVDQRPIAIAPTDYAADLYAKVADVARGQLTDIVDALAHGDLPLRPQNGALTNHWRKRTAVDGAIDWRMSARSIYNLVRALSRPYPGAHCASAAGPIKVWRTEVGPAGANNLEPGKVLGADRSAFLVKCGEGTLRITDHEFPAVPSEGSYL